MKLLQKPRIILQLIILALVGWVVWQSTDPEAYCPLGGLLSIGSRFVNGASSCQMGEAQMFMGIALVVAVLLVGKLFCSHICPIGTVTEWLGRLGRKMRIQLRRIPTWLDRPLRLLKYAILLPVLYYTATSSELFCKTFEPYYVATTGFGADTVFFWSLIALVATILGSLVIRQFWCKYLCPLGALSNLAAVGIFSISTLLLYLGLLKLGVHLSVFWLFLVWVIGGAVIEFLPQKFVLTPFMRIRRNPDTCTDCKLCDKACPYDIPVSRMKSVDHIDCTMCTDCVVACPVPNTLTINRRNWRWVPALATVVLIALAYGFTTRYEITTLSERWGVSEAAAGLTRYEMTIKNVKCYGTSKALLRKVKNLKGLHGVDTYAKSHRVIFYYDSTKLNKFQIRKAVFTPYRSKVRIFKEYTPQELEVAYFGVRNLEDQVDNTNLIRALRQSKYVFGLESQFGEPVKVLIYYDPEKISPREIVDLIETREITYKLPDGKEETARLNFQVEEGPEILTRVSVETFLKHLFPAYARKFKEYRQHNPRDIRVYEIGMPGADNFLLRRYLPHLTSHLSQHDGILGLETFYTDRPVGWIYFDPTRIDTARIKQALTAPELLVKYTNGETKPMKNPFRFENRGQIRRVDEIELIKNRLKEKLTFLGSLHGKKN